MNRSQLKENLNNWRWRLRNLYRIRDASGADSAFKPNPVQEKFFDDLWYLNNVLKARREGVSTAVDLMAFDKGIFAGNRRFGIVDKSLTDAKFKLEKLRHAWETLGTHEDETIRDIGISIKQSVELVKDATDEMRWSNGFVATCGTSFRGGDLQDSHISEFANIAYRRPEDAKEIHTGALNAPLPGSYQVIECTHTGGRFGLAYDMLKLAMDNQGKTKEDLASIEWRFHFFGWQLHEIYFVNNERHAFRPEMLDYFAHLESQGITLTHGQKVWYDLKEREQKTSMKSEFPSTPDEALESSVEGSIYGAIIAKLRAGGAVLDFKPDTRFPFFTVWDIGFSDFTSIWLVQLVGREIHWYRWHENSQEPASYYANVMREWEHQDGMRIAAHFLPHDADAREKGTGKTYADHLREAGLQNIRIVPRTPDTWTTINEGRELLPRSVFHKTNCDSTRSRLSREYPSGLQCLEFFHTKVVEGTAIKEMPVHDETSHSAAAAGTLFEAHRRGMLEGISSTAIESRRRRYPRVITNLARYDNVPQPEYWDDDDVPRPRVIRYGTTARPHHSRSRSSW